MQRPSISVPQDGFAGEPPIVIAAADIENDDFLLIDFSARQDVIDPTAPGTAPPDSRLDEAGSAETLHLRATVIGDLA